MFKNKKKKKNTRAYVMSLRNNKEKRYHNCSRNEAGDPGLVVTRQNGVLEVPVVVGDNPYTAML
eukprot:scaffold252000_cov66-Attheya_sp.AAC.5